MIQGDFEYSCPRVFISSTCSDLSDMRASLRGLLHSWGFEVLLSEDFPFHPLDHPHDSAFRQVDRSDLFLLIVKKRFGTTHYSAREFSITQLEYLRAIRETKPVFAYISHDLLTAVTLFDQNPSADYSSIVDDVRVLEWVSTLSRSISRKPFSTVDDVISDLKIQIPALFGYCLRLSAAIRPPNPHDLESWISHGRLLRNRGMPHLAIYCFDQALSIDPTYLEALEWKVVSLKNCGNLTEAESLAKFTLQQYPHSVKTMWNLQHILLEKGDLLESIDIGRKTIQFAPEDYRVWLDLGKAYEKASYDSDSKSANLQAALDCFEKSMTLRSSVHEAREGVFRVRLKLGQSPPTNA